MSETIKRWRGLVALLGSTVESGASAVERVHLATARTSFRILEGIPVVATPALVVDQVHAAAVGGTYASIRLVTRVVTKVLDIVLDAVDEEDPPPGA
jgi:hypothetical protein